MTAIRPSEPVTLIKGADIGFIPPTPLVPPHGEDAVPEATRLLLKFGALYGHPVGYKQEQSGRLIQHVLPNPKTEFSQISSSSKTVLKLHTETAFHPYKPDIIILMCLRGDPNAPTTYASFPEIIADLDVHTMYELMRPQFYIQPDPSFKKGNESFAEWLVPIIECRHREWRFCFDEDLMRGKSPVAESALGVLRETVAKHTKEIVLEAGDVLILDNHRVVHGRKPFQPRYDGTDRWLMRLLVRSALPERDNYTRYPHPVINTEFATV